MLELENIKINKGEKIKELLKIKIQIFNYM